MTRMCRLIAHCSSVSDAFGLTIADQRALCLLMNWKRILYAAVLILLVAYVGYIRGQDLLARGLMEHDEGHALLNANTWHHILKWTLSGGPMHNDPNALATLKMNCIARGAHSIPPANSAIACCWQ